MIIFFLRGEWQTMVARSVSKVSRDQYQLCGSGEKFCPINIKIERDSSLQYVMLRIHNSFHFKQILLC